MADCSPCIFQRVEYIPFQRVEYIPFQRVEYIPFQRVEYIPFQGGHTDAGQPEE